MAAPTSNLRSVQTYQRSGLGYLQNAYCGIAKANKKFKDFEKLTGQLGSTVTFDQPPQMIGSSGLTASFKGVTQLVETLTVDQSYNVPFSFTNQDYLFNAENYIDVFNESAIIELGAQIEANVLNKTILGNTFRAYSAGITSNKVDAIDSYTKLATAVTNYKNYGSPKGMLEGFLPDTEVPAIIGTGLNQFATSRNNEIANSWELGAFSNTNWCSSNLLPLHTAGSIGNDGETMTVVSINAAGDELTLNGVTASTATLHENDIIEFNDDVSGHDNIRYLTRQGHQTSGQKVQVRVTSTATADGTGQIVASIYPALNSDTTDAAHNISTAVAAGMELKAYPNHRAGVIYGGGALYLGMPKLPSEDPFPTANEYDSESGCSIRVYYGSKFGENERGFVSDAIWGSHLVPEYAIRLMFPE